MNLTLMTDTELFLRTKKIYKTWQKLFRYATPSQSAVLQHWQW